MNNKFIKNAFTLSVGVFISKFLGFIFIIPFSYLIGKEGLALYTYAYIPYSLFIDLATLGIPMGFSKFVSVNNSIGEDTYINYSINRLKKLMIIFGLISFLTMIILAPFYANLVKGDIHNIQSIINVIRIVGLSLLIIPLMSLYRGYFQGMRIMFYTAFSQILEQIVRISIILLGGLLIIMIFDNKTYAVYIAVSAAFFGAIVSLIYLIVKFKKHNINRTKKEKEKKGMYKEVLMYSIPFLVYGSSFTIYNFIDSIMFNKVIQNEIIYGIYSFEIQKIVMIPVSIVAAISTALLPNIAHNFKLGNINIIKHDFLKSLIIVFLITLPIMIFVFIFNEFSYDLLFEYNEYGPKILKYYILLAVIFSLYSLSMAMMIGLNLGKYLMISILLGILIKAGLNFYLLNIFSFYGAIIGTFLGYTVSISFNFVVIIKKICSKNITT